MFSIVIACKNEVHNIARVLEGATAVSDDVVVYDSGSTDGTTELIRKSGARLVEGPWLGYGMTKQTVVTMARHEWVLCLDADEALDNELQAELRALVFKNEQTVYRIPFKNFLGSKHLKWGEWGGDSHVRLFNKKVVNWDDAPVHERLLIPNGVREVKLKGSVLHQTMRDSMEYAHKMVNYALLNADKYFKQGKKATWFKRNFSGSFSFLKHYIMELGFLDGWEGLISARMTSFYTSLKYARLYELEKQKKEDSY